MIKSRKHTSSRHINMLKLNDENQSQEAPKLSTYGRQID